MKSQIDTLHEETEKLLSKLYDVSSKNGLHLDNDLETGLFMLMVDNDYNEMFLLKSRIVTAIKQIENGTFKIKEADKILSDKKVA